MNPSLNRRQFVTASAALGFSPALFGQQPPVDDAFSFFVIGDTHFLAKKEDTKTLDERSAKVTTKLVERLNELPGQDIPMMAGGGKVRMPLGLIHAGDCIDSGDKPLVKMQETEWAHFEKTFGLSGKDGQLKYPIYEVHGNHDSPRGDGLAVKKIIDRNKKRLGVTNVSKNGLHYSWDWQGVHFVCLGIVVGQSAAVTRKRRYSPLDSLDFLVNDLKEKVGTTGKPVILTHHVDMLRYSQPLPVEDKRAETMEWDPADVNAFYDAIKPYRIAAIFYGHTHARNIFRWNGSPKGADQGIAVFNVDNSSHFASKQQACFYVEVNQKAVTVREYSTPDAWETVTWTPQVWTAPLPAVVKS